MRKIGIKFALCVLSAISVSACEEAPNQAKDSVAAPTGRLDDGNWMRDYVELRVRAANEKFPNRRGPSPKIVGGVRAQPNDNPFQVALLNKDVSDNYGAQFCGGTLIAPTIVVTAAHCSDFITAGQVHVLTGTQSLKAGGMRRDVTKIVIHPNWNSQTNDYDVAVWHLSSPATGPFATLNQTEVPTKTNLLATGWGALSQGGKTPTELQKVSLPVTDATDCNDANSYAGAITGRMICAGEEGGGTDTCQGDSGGPLTQGSALVGITSWGRGCAQKNFYGVYAKVSNPEIRQFIMAND